MAQISRNKRRTRGKETHKSERNKSRPGSTTTDTEAQTDDDDGAQQAGEVDEEVRGISQTSPQPHAEPAQDATVQQPSTSHNDLSHTGQGHTGSALVPRNFHQTRTANIRTGNPEDRRTAQEREGLPQRTDSSTRPTSQEQPLRRNT